MKEIKLMKDVTLFVSESTARKIDKCRKLVADYANYRIPDDCNSIDEIEDAIYDLNCYKEEVWKKIMGCEPF